MALNSVTLSGNVVRDAEIRSTQSGVSVMNFSLAVNERAKNQHTGEWEDRPSFFDCVMFGNRADKMAGMISKGTKIAVLGRLRQSSWETEQGRRSKVEVVVDGVEFMSRKREEQAEQQQADLYSDDMPF